MRIALPSLLALGCLIAASQVDVPLVSFLLFVLGLGFVFDAGTLLFARATGNGGMRDYRQ